MAVANPPTPAPSDSQGDAPIRNYTVAGQVLGGHGVRGHQGIADVGSARPQGRAKGVTTCGIFTYKARCPL